jgi:hypothetical protein
MRHLRADPGARRQGWKFGRQSVEHALHESVAQRALSGACALDSLINRHALNDAMILSYDANLSRMEISEKTGLSRDA